MKTIKKIISIFLFIISTNYVFAQTSKIAILDFENTSGKIEYDGLGKAISNMLITDLKNNIHPKKAEFFERSQLNKLLDEQKLQKGKNFDPKTAVDFGKLSGVNYVFVGSVFILEGNCTFSSKLIDVQTSRILISKDVNGKIESWQQLKSQLAEAIAVQLNNPITLDPSYKDQPTTLTTINQYGKILTTIDQGNIEKAEQMRGLFEETNPEFKYFADLKDDIEKIKQRVSELENITQVLTDAFNLGDKAEAKKQYESAIKYFKIFLDNPGDQGFIENKKLYAFDKLSFSQFMTGDYSNALINSRKAQLIYKYHPGANEIELLSLVKLNQFSEVEQKINFIIDSLTFDNEFNFKSQGENESLNWESIRYYFGLRGQPKSEESDIWLYRGLLEVGYGKAARNEFKIYSILEKHRLILPKSVKISSRYPQLEKKILNSNNKFLFSSDQILYFFKLSGLYADELYAKGELEKYKIHLLKEIKRMQGFGVPRAEYDDTREPLGPNKDKYKHKIWQESNKVLSDLGFSNSMQEFYDEFPAIFGKFIFKYLILLIEQEKLNDAANLYDRISNTSVADKDSYFNGYYWDVILGIRIITDDRNSRTPLASDLFKKNLDKKIQKELINLKIPESILIKVKNINVPDNLNLTKEVEIPVNEFPGNEVTIGNQVWMTKNLDVEQFRNGDIIPHAKSDKEWEEAGRNKQPAWSYYQGDSENGRIFGKLYNGYAVIDPRGLAPKGWQIPNDVDWDELFNFLGDNRGSKLKSVEGWSDDRESATNESGFFGLPGGTRWTDGDYFLNPNVSSTFDSGFWWSSTLHYEKFLRYIYLRARDYSVSSDISDLAVGFSIRCIKVL